MKTVLVDNYDSFTFNLFQLLWEVNGTEPVVLRNDEASWEEVVSLGFEAVVISPGPGRPERPADFGICADLIRHSGAPLLGVCLGQQGIGWVHGAEVVAAPEPMHGRVDLVEHAGDPLFAGIPSRFAAVRYHSLCLAQPLPDCFAQLARGRDGVPMAIAHRERPQWGVQFHPESVAGEHGRRLLANFRDLALASRGSFFTHRVKKEPRDGVAPVSEDPDRGDARLEVRQLAGVPDPALVFGSLYGGSRAAFWLDSARVGEGARFSFMGDASGPMGAVVTYDVGAGEARIERNGRTEHAAGPLLDLIERERRRLKPAVSPSLPFDFDCGFAGYLGYEMRAELEAGEVPTPPQPDAAFILADRMIAFDHERQVTYLLCLAADGDAGVSDAWLETTMACLEALEGDADRCPPLPIGGESHRSRSEPRLARSRERYLAEIEACREALIAGESYEVCLTNRVELDTEAEPLDLYRRLRRANPAPFGAYLRFGELAVLSSSPERFLAVDRSGRVEAKPIKGTARRDPDAEEDALLAARLASDEKSRSENLMIADLLRNDLASVCERGSVEAAPLMAVESYATVHQLVTTVRGRLRAGLTAVDAIAACFPPGSMTGAPKRRTVEILDRLEGEPRGVYSGAIGYLGLGGGSDLSVAIRTIVLNRGRAAIGAGGAIVLQSDPEEEFEEMLLKAAAPLHAFAEYLGSEARRISLEPLISHLTR